MIIQLEQEVSTDKRAAILQKVKELNFKVAEVKTMHHHYYVCLGTGDLDIRQIGVLDGVRDVHRVSDDYKLVSRKWKVNLTEIDLGNDVVVKEGNFSIIAGPCSIECEQQIFKTVNHLRENGVKIMRGGVFKPRSSPYSFRGMGLEGLKMFYEIAKDSGIKVISEVMEVAQIEMMYDYLDIYQVGTRNAQNFNLLHALGNVDKPVLIKRGISGTIEELLHSAEYVFSNGNEKLILCERGIRTFEKAYRNTLDLNAIPVLKEKTHLPVIVDPSHGTGIREYVEPMALASVMAGADGIMFEIHELPEEAMSDGQQTLNFDESAKLIGKVRTVYKLKRQF